MSNSNPRTETAAQPPVTFTATRKAKKQEKRLVLLKDRELRSEARAINAIKARLS